MKAQLDCDHIIEFNGWRDLQLYMECGECKANIAVVAVETREWKFNCSQCRFARWAGQSRENAEIARRKHNMSTHHQIGLVEFIRHPDSMHQLRLLFGRRIRNVILEKPHSIRGTKPIRREPLIPQPTLDSEGIPF